MGIKLNDSISLLTGEQFTSNRKLFMEAVAILETGESPLQSKYREKLFQSIIDKSHIDFGDIPKSEGDIRSYSGYNQMMETLRTIESLATDQGSNDALKYTKIILTAIRNIEELRLQYVKGFQANSSYVMLEYNTYVYTCVEATTTLIYEYADYIKVPSQQELTIKLKDTKLRANEFFFTQLTKFNSVCSSMGINYRKMLESMTTGDKNNFVGLETLVGTGAIAAVAVLIVPVTRSLIYRIYSARNKLSDCFDLQAKFLEMNKLAVEANDSFTVDKKREIIRKQEQLAKSLRSAANVLRVSHATSQRNADSTLKKDNSMLTLDSIKNSVDSDPLVLI